MTSATFFFCEKHHRGIVVQANTKAAARPALLAASVCECCIDLEYESCSWKMYASVTNGDRIRGPNPVDMSFARAAYTAGGDSIECPDWVREAIEDSFWQ